MLDYVYTIHVIFLSLFNTSSIERGFCTLHCKFNLRKNKHPRSDPCMFVMLDDVLLIILIAVEHDANSEIRLNNEIARFSNNLFSMNKMKQ